MHSDHDRTLLGAARRLGRPRLGDGRRVCLQGTHRVPRLRLVQVRRTRRRAVRLQVPRQRADGHEHPLLDGSGGMMIAMIAWVGGRAQRAQRAQRAHPTPKWGEGMGWASAASLPNENTTTTSVLVEQLAGEEWDGRASAASPPGVMFSSSSWGGMGWASAASPPGGMFSSSSWGGMRSRVFLWGERVAALPVHPTPPGQPSPFVTPPHVGRVQ